ncbi:UPF0481 protein At3g47200 [Eucalyptus grandis]|uniref:UPF0481 protein At3g47200 n=1 Tax=Eucalyptus grandis TaxID=71139 RepID=UPI00192EB054|nr:UPF0481 protein At3g47200 [Eucalyptus grandis]
MAAVESGLLKVQQEPSGALRIGVENNGAEIVPRDELRLSSSECRVSIKEMLAQLGREDQDYVQSPWLCDEEKASICRIPQYLKDDEDKGYDPQIVSLGPYHHGKEHLRPMEQHKLRCLHHILTRFNHGIDLYLDSVKGFEKRARTCYEETISMSSNEFVEMMVLDGCFVIELLLGVDTGFQGFGYHDNDPIFSVGPSILKTKIRRDMIMLENQIPLFILDRLLSLQLGEPDQEKHVVELALQFFSPLTPIWAFMVETECPSDPRRLHCLGAYWSNTLPSSAKQGGTKMREEIMWRMRITRWSQRQNKLNFCVTKLREAGIVFRNVLHDRVGNIEFLDGVLYIPKLTIDEGTRSLFFNLIAFEQSHIHCGNHVTAYVIFMHSLIHSPEDVDHLRDRMILDHCLGSNAEVVDLFNCLCQKLAFDITDSYLFDLRTEVSLYCLRRRLPFKMATAAFARKWNFWGADLRKKYFNNPWSTISVIAASILLVLTFTQTFYGVYGYYRPSRP